MSMKLSISKTISLLSGWLSLQAIALAYPQTAHAQTSTWDGVCVYAEDKEVATLQGLQCLLANILSVTLTLIGIAGFIMLLVGSMKWLLSGGNAQHVEKAKNTMTYAVVGLIVALSAFIILNLVAEFTGIPSILKFTIPSSDTMWGFPTP